MAARSPDRLRTTSRVMRSACAAVVLELAACASIPGQTPVEVRVTPAGYEVDGVAVPTAQQVGDIIAGRGVRHVRLVLDRDASAQQIGKAVAVLREAGASLGITDNGQATK